VRLFCSGGVLARDLPTTHHRAPTRRYAMDLCSVSERVLRKEYGRTLGLRREARGD
jgi:hypothetical protein